MQGSAQKRSISVIVASTSLLVLLIIGIVLNFVPHRP